MSIRIENYREANASEKFCAIFDVYFIKSTEVKRNIKLVKSQKGTHFLSYPSFCVEDEYGKKIWTKYYQFSDEKQRELDSLILQELSPLVRGGIQLFKRD